MNNDLEYELDYTKALLNVVSADRTLVNVPKIKERFNMLRETLSDIEDHYVTYKDEDARVGHKSEDSSFFGYKTHMAMSDERIITAATVTSGEKEDGPNCLNSLNKAATIEWKWKLPLTMRRVRERAIFRSPMIKKTDLNR